MNDKERLEEIKQDVKMTRKDLAVSPSNEMTLHMDVMLNSMDYLIEQAERVQELERINRNLKFNIDTALDHTEKHRLENNRYREAIHKGVNATRYTNSEVAYMLSEALEERTNR